jgi:putative membrane protein
MGLRRGGLPMQALKRDKKIEKYEITYAQQHLANERTYLAWLRTAVSIIGVGFLSTSLHFTISIVTNPFINTIAIFLGIFACVFGCVIAILSTRQYNRKRERIESGIFIPSKYFILVVSILFGLLTFIILLYLSVLLFSI